MRSEDLPLIFDGGSVWPPDDELSEAELEALRIEYECDMIELAEFNRELDQ